MAILQLKRGATANISSVVLKEGELGLDTTLNQLMVGDGSTAGGVALKIASAPKLDTARTFRVNLASTSTANFDGSANVTPGVTGTLALGNGGTGATTAATARSNLAAAASGANSDITGLTGLTAVSPLPGVTDASDAAAGKVGQLLSATASNVALTNATAINVVSLTLTPGDWDVTGAVNLRPSGGTVTQFIAGMVTTSASSPVFPNRIVDSGSFTGVEEYALPTVRYSVSANTTIYLVVSAGFTSGTATSDGLLRARRVR